ncbi:hypothetical protein [Streptomyces sp. NPDC060198]|uniref:hypothetical protein n=1 Tax=Streptomyces sp. NPDC060198 TaxID=3347070 RepID=UPI003646F8C1
MSVTLAAGLSGATSATITSAGLAVGLALLAVEHVTWWRGATAGGGGKKGGAPVEGGGKAKDPRALIPFWFGVAFGTLAVACPAGLLGYGAGFLRWGGNTVGGTVMSWMTGQSAPTVATGSAPSLDGYGALVVTALVIVLWLLRKKFGKATTGKWKKGVVVGVLIGIGTGVFAMVGNLVVPGANDLGAWALDGLIHGDLGSML